MKYRRLVALMLSLLPIALVGSGSASAQYKEPYPLGESLAPQVVDMGFPFVVSTATTGTKTMPAGKYDIEQPTRDFLVFRSANGVRIEVPVITRLVKPSTPLVDALVVFDKLGDSYYISEVWIPGADGFLVGAMKEMHTHVVVKAAKKK
jgi:hypothetical protein